jgi:hypothetical protein
VIGQALKLAPSGLSASGLRVGSMVISTDTSPAVTNARVASTGHGDVDRRAVESAFASYGASRRSSPDADAVANASEDRWLDLLARHRARRTNPQTTAR